MVFSHQRETVIALSNLFETVHVYTPEVDEGLLPPNVNVTILPWKSQSRLKSVFCIYRTLFPILIRNKNGIIFNYMTDVHAALLAPITWVLRIKHYLWYAHAHNSGYLLFSSFFVSNIISSTRGSCKLPINQNKVRFINQGINESSFPFKLKTIREMTRIYYYGRLDRSKNIHLLNDLIVELNQETNKYTLDIFGESISPASCSYICDIKTSSNLSHEICFRGKIERKSISAISESFDFFINLFAGSLDKTLIENTLMGLPVITWNQEFCSQFGTWSGGVASESLEFIIQEVLSLNSKTEDELQTEIIRRHCLALEYHSFDGWIQRLSNVLQGREQS